MNKIIYIFCVFLLLTEAKAQLLVGPKIGYNYSTMLFDSKEYTDNYTINGTHGFNIGGVVNYIASKHWSLHSEIFYSQKGRIIENRSDNDWVKNISLFHYLDIPVLFRCSFDLGEQRFYLNAGPLFSFWLGGSGNLSAIELGNQSIDYEYDFTKTDNPKSILENVMAVPNANRFQIGIDAGFGFEFEVFKENLVQVDFRYSYGNTNIGQVKDNTIVGLDKYKENFGGTNQVISISTSFFFFLDVNKALKQGKSTEHIR
ncbi:MAG: porin family protein [Chitinophagaceae bacterium]|nr:porin family protein [Chitinophagaceae bacterium]